MKIKLLLVTVLVLAFYSSKAQKSSFSMGPEINIPSGNSSNISTIGVGVYMKGEFPVAEKFSFTATASLNTFYGKKVLQYTAPNLSYLPLRGGLKYYPSENFYVEGQAGVSFSIKNDSKTTFIWAPGIGTFLNMGNSHKLDIGLRYESQKNSVQYTMLDGSTTANFGYIGLRVGYVF